MQFRSTAARSGISVALLLCLGLVSSCAGPGRPFTKSMTLGGKKVSARTLNRGRYSYITHCQACHGMEGDGKGPAGYALRPPPRNFKQGKFKFAAVAAGQLPNDEDLFRIVKYGLHGTAMIPWDEVPDRDLLDIIQYIKTLSPRWLDSTPGTPIVPSPDPWGDARRAEAVTRGMKVYHGLAQCLLCHPAYAPAEDVNAASLELSKREAPLRPDAFHGALKESDYGVKLMPPDFTRDHIRSGEKLPDLYRTIASGIGGTAMPAWKGALPEDDIWAMAYYVRSLIELKGTPQADARREALIASHAAPVGTKAASTSAEALVPAAASTAGTTAN